MNIKMTKTLTAYMAGPWVFASPTGIGTFRKRVQEFCFEQEVCRQSSVSVEHNPYLNLETEES